LFKDPRSPMLNRAAQDLYPPGTAMLSWLQTIGLSAQAPAGVAPKILTDLGFFTTPELRLPVAAAVSPGQTVVISPLQAALAAAALSHSGIRPAPRLVMSVKTPMQGWVVLPALTASQLLPRKPWCSKAARIGSGAAWPAKGIKKFPGPGQAHSREPRAHPWQSSYYWRMPTNLPLPPLPGTCSTPPCSLKRMDKKRECQPGTTPTGTLFIDSPYFTLTNLRFPTCNTPWCGKAASNFSNTSPSNLTPFCSISRRPSDLLATRPAAESTSSTLCPGSSA
jgi:hypothetical protein